MGIVKHYFLIRALWTTALVVLNSLPIYLWSQESNTYKILYSLSFQRDSTDMSRRYGEMQLIVSGGLSLFQEVEHAKRDSVRYMGNSGGDMGQGPGIFYSIVKKDENHSIVHYETFVEPRYCYYYEEELLEQESWQLKQDTMTIGGYQCQKATIVFGGRTWTAWFAPEIPIYDGPYKFSGLPGLILRAHDEKESWIFDLSAMEKIDPATTISLSYLPSPQKVKKSEFYRIKKEMLDNILQIRELPGHSSFTKVGESKAEAQRRHDINRKKDNNWIELYP